MFYLGGSDECRCATWQVANVGDASAVLATTTLASQPSPTPEGMMADWGQRVVREVTKQHRLSNQSERERLKLAGVALHGGESRLYGEGQLALHFVDAKMCAARCINPDTSLSREG